LARKKIPPDLSAGLAGKCLAAKSHAQLTRPEVRLLLLIQRKSAHVTVVPYRHGFLQLL
jgi:hypothetical protein